MNIIFLDIDGVLNADEDFGGRSKPNPYIGSYMGITGARVKKLKKIVDATGAQLVLTSTWRVAYWSYLSDRTNRMGKYLYNKLRKESLTILDTTTTRGRARGKGILQWLSEHPDTQQWIVLDDEIFDDYDETIMKHLIKTNEQTGLTDELANKAIELLNND